MDSRLPAYTADSLVMARCNDFVRLACCLAETDGSWVWALKMHAERWPRSLCSDLIAKALSNPGSSLEPAWAAPLSALRPLATSFVELLTPRTLLGRVPGARVGPLNVSVGVQLAGGSYRFVGQTAPAPAGNLQLASVALPPLRVAGIITLSRELARLSSPNALAVVRNDMLSGMALHLDQQFIDPTAVAVANISPGSVTSTAPSFGSTTAAADIDRAVGDFFDANPRPLAPVWVMGPAVASAAATATGEQNINVQSGGVLRAIPVLTSPEAGDVLALIDGGKLLIGDDGDIEIDLSGQASVELSTTPTSPTSSGTVTVSLFQQGLLGLRGTRLVNWRLASPTNAIYTTVGWA